MAEFKEFERRFKFKPRFKYGWFIEVGRTDSIKTRLEVFPYIFLYPANFYITTKDRFTRIRIIPRSSPVVELCFGGRETSSSTDY